MQLIISPVGTKENKQVVERSGTPADKKEDRIKAP